MHAAAAYHFIFLAHVCNLTARLVLRLLLRMYSLYITSLGDTSWSGRFRRLPCILYADPGNVNEVTSLSTFTALYSFLARKGLSIHT